MRWDLFSVVVEALHVYIRCPIDFGFSKLSWGKDEGIGSLSLVMLFMLLHLQQFAVGAGDSISMNGSEFAGSGPAEADGEDAKEGCMAELLFPVRHQLWPVAV